jgi:uncharacterized RDD family membrane protein YckC
MKTFIKPWLATLLAVEMMGLPFTAPLLAQTNEPTEVNLTATNHIPAASDTAVAVAAEVSNATEVTNPSQRRRGPIISLGGRAELAAGDSAEVVVAIGGSAKAGGKVREAVVAIGGDAEADDEVGGAVVAIGGDATARGNVREAVVAIAGDAEAQGQVRDAVVAIMGNVKLGSNAVVRGDVVSIGGTVEAAEGAQINGQIVEVGVAQYPILAPLQGVADWLRHCLLKFRLLAPQLGWYWIFAGIFLLLYLLIAVAIPRPVAACVNELTERPATTFLLGLLMKLLLPLVLLVLAITGIGIIVVPFLLAAVFIGALIGKVALFEYLGGKILKLFGVTVPRPVLGLLAGFVLITLLYMVPLLSFLIYTLVGLWALGIAVTAAFSGARRESPPRPPYQPQSMPPTGTPPGPMGIPVPPVANFAAGAETPRDATAPQSTFPPNQTAATARVPEAYTLPRAGFWERMGAAFLDVIIVAILSAFVGGLPLGFLVALAYFAGLWAWKGTTIGGIVLNLKVVRLDDQPVTFAVGLVRSLAAALSVVVFFLGFLWIIFDRDKQSWHDKIAGTVVARSPRSLSLVCL